MRISARPRLCCWVARYAVTTARLTTLEERVANVKSRCFKVLFDDIKAVGDGF